MATLCRRGPRPAEAPRRQTLRHPLRLEAAAHRHPFIPFEPICEDDTQPFLLNGLGTIDGELSTKFFYAIRDTFYHQGIDFLTDHRDPVVYVTFPDWFEEEILWNMTTKAVWRIIEEEKGITRSEDVDLPGFKFGLPNCEALRAIAIR